MLGCVGLLVRAGHGEMPGRTPELPGFSVADHVEGLGAEDGEAEEDAEDFWFTEEDVPGEAREFFDLTLAGAAFGGDDLDCGVDAVGIVEAGFDLREELVE